MPVANSTQRTLTDLLFEKADVGLCLVAPDGTVLRANAEWLRSTGFDAEQVVGEDVVELFPSTRDMALAMHARARAGHSVEVPRHAQVVNGRESWWEGSIEPVPMEGGTGLLITSREVANDGRAGARPGTQDASARAADLRAVIASLPIGFLICDERGRFVAVNDAADALLGGVTGDCSGPAGGYTLHTLEGAPFPPDELPLVRALRGERTSSVEIVARRPDAPERVLLIAGGPIRDTGGRVAGAVATMQDVTHQKRVEQALRASEEQFRTLYSQTPAMMHSIDQQGRLLSVSDAWLETLGYAREEVIGQRSVEFLTPESRAFAEAVVLPEYFRTGVCKDVPYRMTKKNGDVIDVLLSGIAHRDAEGRFVRSLAVLVDVTQHNIAEAALRDADRRKTEFLGVLSHELRNPLAPIRNSVFLLDHTPSGSDQAKRAKEVIRRQTEHLTRLVEDLLDVTRITRGKIVLQKSRLDLRDVARKAASDLHSLFDQARIALRVDHGFTPVWVEADPTRLEQVIGNVLQNAIKFTPAEGTVEMTVAMRTDKAVLSIRDDGVGIDPEMLSRVFDAFAQADQSLARTKGGLGLGLALVKGLVELHGGTVEARSEGAERGTEILIALPLITGAVVPEAARGARVAPRSRSILVIEDNLDAGQSLADILELGGHRVTVVRDGRSGIEAARELRPEVVLCDIGLPDLDGYDVARALRRDETLRGTRLVAVTGYAQPEDRQRARDAGFDAHLAKPMDLGELERALE